MFRDSREARHVSRLHQSTDTNRNLGVLIFGFTKTIQNQLVDTSCVIDSYEIVPEFDVDLCTAHQIVIKFLNSEQPSSSSS